MIEVVLLTVGVVAVTAIWFPILVAFSSAIHFTIRSVLGPY